MDHAEFSEIIDEMVERKETHFADCRRWILLGSCTDDDSQRPTPVDCINSRLISLTKHRRVFLHRSRNYSRVFSTHIKNTRPIMSRRWPKNPAISASRFSPIWSGKWFFSRSPPGGQDDAGPKPAGEQIRLPELGFARASRSDPEEAVAPIASLDFRRDPQVSEMAQLP